MNFFNKLIFLIFICINFSYAMQKVPPVCLKIKKISQNASDQEYKKLCAEIIHANESVGSCISKYRKAKRADKVETLKKAEPFPISDQEWDEHIDKPAKEMIAQLQRPELSIDQLVINDGVSKNIERDVKNEFVKKRMQVPVIVTTGLYTYVAGIIPIENGYGFIVNPINLFKFWDLGIPKHELQHALENDGIYEIHYLKYLSEKYPEVQDTIGKNASYIAKKDSLDRSQEKIADQIPAAEGDQADALVVLSTLKKLEKIKRGCQIDSIHPSTDKRITWAQRIYNLKKVEQEELRKKRVQDFIKKPHLLSLFCKK